MKRFEVLLENGNCYLCFASSVDEIFDRFEKRDLIVSEIRELASDMYIVEQE